MDLIVKYYPKTLSDFIGNKQVVSKILHAISSKHIILLLGPPGSGKTTLVKLIIKENNYNVLSLCRSNIHHIDSFIKNETIESFFDKRKKCVFIDDIDALLSDKITMTTLLSMCKTIQSENIYLIMTCNINEEKKCTELKKICDVFKIQYPCCKDSFIYIMNIFEKENVQYDTEYLLKLCSKYNGCLREIIEQFFCGNDTTNMVSLFKNRNNFECITKLLQENNITKYDERYLIDDDAILKSFLLFENIPDEIHYNRYPKNMINALCVYKDIIDKYIHITFLEKYMYVNHDWFLWEIIYILCFNNVVSILKQHPREKDNNKHQLRLSQILSKTSHKQILNKRLKNAYDGLTQENKLIMANDAVHNKTERERKKSLNMDECNFINTYSKYFS